MLKRLLRLLTTVAVVYLAGFIIYLLGIPLITEFILMIWALTLYALTTTWSLIVIIISVLFYCFDYSKKTSSDVVVSNAANSLERERKEVLKSIPNGMGALLEHPRLTNIIGYYKDGVVYTRHESPIGTYVTDGEFISFYYDDKRIGWCLYNNNEYITIYNYSDLANTWGSEKVGDIYNNFPDIHPKQDSIYKTVFFTDIDDPAGAAAAYVILCYGYGQHNTSIMQYFLQ